MISSWPIVWRAATGAVLALMSLWLTISTHLFATALLLLMAAALCYGDLWHRSARRAERHTALHTAIRPGLPAVEYLQTMLDTVSAALIVLHEDDSIELANRAAHRLAGTHASRLAHVTAIGADAAQRIASLAPGERQVIRLYQGRDALISVSGFSGNGGLPCKLISVQLIAGELDAVEVKAWRDMMRVLMHEIMNSLTPIASLAESLINRPERALDGSDALGALEAIHRRSRGLIGFADNYRQIVELPKPALEDIDPGSYIAALGLLLRARAQQAGIQFEASAEAATQPFRADPALLEQALINLVRNAFDATTGRAGGSVHLSVVQEQTRLCISVCDNGCGVEPSQRGQLGVPFFSTKPNGSGVGLSLARHIALAHGGGLEFQPNEPRGSRFMLWLPQPR
jgi:two-component system nitrogen regulation sensor histidine kinase NtrY